MVYIILIQFRHSKHQNKVFRTIAAKAYWNAFNYLTHLMPVYPFFYSGFLTFSGAMENVITLLVSFAPQIEWDFIIMYCKKLQKNSAGKLTHKLSKIKQISS